MEITKIINNNVVSCIDQDGRELVVMGKGIGFGKKTGQEIDENSAEKIFRMDNKDSLERFKELLSDIPLEYVQLSNEIIAFAKSSIGIELNQNVYLTMIDHIHFAIERFKKQMHFANALFGEMSDIYINIHAIRSHPVWVRELKHAGVYPGQSPQEVAPHVGA